jgi:hypothetical protein
MSDRKRVINPAEEPNRRWSNTEEMPSMSPSATEVQEPRELLRKIFAPHAWCAPRICSVLPGDFESDVL